MISVVVPARRSSLLDAGGLVHLTSANAALITSPMDLNINIGLAINVLDSCHVVQFSKDIHSRATRLYADQTPRDQAVPTERPITARSPEDILIRSRDQFTRILPATGTPLSINGWGRDAGSVNERRLITLAAQDNYAASWPSTNIIAICIDPISS